MKQAIATCFRRIHQSLTVFHQIPLFKASELCISADGRVNRMGKIWSPSLDDVRAMAIRMLQSPTTLRVEIVSDNGVTIEVLRR